MASIPIALRIRAFHLSGETNMKRAFFSSFLCVLALFVGNALAAAGVNNPSGEIALTSGWRVTQDVHELGERIGWYEPAYVTPQILDLYKKAGIEPSLGVDWQPIERLVHLQLLLAA